MNIAPQQMQLLQQNLLRQLFANPELKAYAILDGASNPALLDYLYAEQPPEFACLYRGDLEPDMAECAPYLAKLELGSPFTQWVTGMGWGLHWGIFAVANSDLRGLRDHLRKLNMIYEPETHRPVLFRYYDPRVLNRFLPSCDVRQLHSFFGPVQAWFAEAEDEICLKRYARNEQQLIADKV